MHRCTSNYIKDRVMDHGLRMDMNKHNQINVDNKVDVAKILFCRLLP